MISSSFIDKDAILNMAKHYKRRKMKGKGTYKINLITNTMSYVPENEDEEENILNNINALNIGTNLNQDEKEEIKDEISRIGKNEIIYDHIINHWNEKDEEEKKEIAQKILKDVKNYNMGIGDDVERLIDIINNTVDKPENLEKFNESKNIIDKQNDIFLRGKEKISSLIEKTDKGDYRPIAVSTSMQTVQRENKIRNNINSIQEALKKINIGETSANSADEEFDYNRKKNELVKELEHNNKILDDLITQDAKKCTLENEKIISDITKYGIEKEFIPDADTRTFIEHFIGSYEDIEGLKNEINNYAYQKTVLDELITETEFNSVLYPAGGGTEFENSVNFNENEYNILKYYIPPKGKGKKYIDIKTKDELKTYFQNIYNVYPDDYDELLRKNEFQYHMYGSLYGIDVFNPLMTNLKIVIADKMINTDGLVEKSLTDKIRGNNIISERNRIMKKIFSSNSMDSLPVDGIDEIQKQLIEMKKYMKYSLNEISEHHYKNELILYVNSILGIIKKISETAPRDYNNVLKNIAKTYIKSQSPVFKPVLKSDERKNLTYLKSYYENMKIIKSFYDKDTTGKISIKMDKINENFEKKYAIKGVPLGIVKLGSHIENFQPIVEKFKEKKSEIENETMTKQKRNLKTSILQGEINEDIRNKRGEYIKELLQYSTKKKVLETYLSDFINQMNDKVKFIVNPSTQKIVKFIPLVSISEPYMVALHNLIEENEGYNLSALIGTKRSISTCNLSIKPGTSPFLYRKFTDSFYNKGVIDSIILPINELKNINVSSQFKDIMRSEKNINKFMSNIQAIKENKINKEEHFEKNPFQKNIFEEIEPQYNIKQEEINVLEEEIKKNEGILEDIQQEFQNNFGDKILEILDTKSKIKKDDYIEAFDKFNSTTIKSVIDKMTDLTKKQKKGIINDLNIEIGELNESNYNINDYKNFFKNLKKIFINPYLNISEDLDNEIENKKKEIKNLISIY